VEGSGWGLTETDGFEMNLANQQSLLIECWRAGLVGFLGEPVSLLLAWNTGGQECVCAGETRMTPKNRIKSCTKGLGCSSVVECMPSIGETLDYIPITDKNKWGQRVAIELV
jgi:hypothetical protein